MHFFTLDRIQNEKTEIGELENWRIGELVDW